MTMSFLKGRLLVATPALGDANFERTVVLLLEHNEEGALGVVLNRPSDIEVLGPLPGWSRLALHPSVVFVGGPVHQGAAIGLGRVHLGAAIRRSHPQDEAEGWEPVLGPIGVIDLSLDPDAMGGPLEGVRIFTGYAGWGEEQLEGEIEEGAWFVIDAEPSDVFTPDPTDLWRQVLRRQPAPLSWFAHYPPDIRWN